MTGMVMRGVPAVSWWDLFAPYAAGLALVGVVWLAVGVCAVVNRMRRRP